MMRKLETIYLQGNNIVYNQDHLEPGLAFEVNAALNYAQEKIEFHGLHTFDNIDIDIKNAYIIEIGLTGNIIDRQNLKNTDILQRFLIKNINLL